MSSLTPLSSENKNNFKFATNSQLFEGVLKRRRRLVQVNKILKERQKRVENIMTRWRLEEQAKEDRLIDRFRRNLRHIDTYKYVYLM